MLPLTIKTHLSNPRRKVGLLSCSQSQRRQCDWSQAIQMTMKSLLGQAEFTNRNEAISSASIVKPGCVIFSVDQVVQKKDTLPVESNVADTSTHRRRQPHPLWLVADPTKSQFLSWHNLFIGKLCIAFANLLAFPERHPSLALTLTARAHPCTRLHKLGYLLLSI